MIAVGDEGHWHDARREALAPDFDFELGAVGGMRRLDVGHGDRVAESGGKAPAGDGADLAVAGEDISALARGSAAFEREADQAPCSALGQLAQDAYRTGEAAFGAA